MIETKNRKGVPKVGPTVTSPQPPLPVLIWILSHQLAMFSTSYSVCTHVFEAKGAHIVYEARRPIP